jgi:hypothetical protein
MGRSCYGEHERGRQFAPAEHVGVVLAHQADIPVLLFGVRHDAERTLI